MPLRDTTDLEGFRVQPGAVAARGSPEDAPNESADIVLRPASRADQHHLLLRLAGLDALASSFGGNWAATRMTLAAVRRNIVSRGMHTRVGHVSASVRAWAAMGFTRRQGRHALERLYQAPALVRVERSGAFGWLRIAALPAAEQLVVHHRSSAPADPEQGAFLRVNLGGLDRLASLLDHNHTAIRIGLRACRRAALPGGWEPGISLTAELMAAMGVSAQRLRTTLKALSACALFQVERSPNHPPRVVAQPGVLALLHVTPWAGSQPG